MILLDTDVCIELLRGNKTVIRKRQHTDDEVAVSFMTVGELYYGAARSAFPEQNRELVESFLMTVPVIESDRGIMSRFGSLKAELHTAKRILTDADVLIAATCLEYCTTLVTGNVKHFKRFKGLALDNWIR